MLLSAKSITLDGLKINYWSNDVSQYQHIRLLLAPGASTGSFFHQFDIPADRPTLFLAPDYPGRGLSDSQPDNTIKGIAHTIIDFLEALELHQPVEIIACSFGTQVAVQALLIKPEIFHSVSLIAPGEYFESSLRLIFRCLFTPVQYIKPLANFYRRVLRHLNIMEDLPAQNLIDINKQWLSTITYKIPQNMRINIPCRIFVYDHDNFISSSSVRKLINLFYTCECITLAGKHPVLDHDFKSALEYHPPIKAFQPIFSIKPYLLWLKNRIFK